MNNHDMVSVPRDLVERTIGYAADFDQDGSVDALHDWLLRPTEQSQGDQDSYPPCDYCGVIPDHHPWHGSGLINGAENRHIHACDGCRGKLPMHPGQHQGEPVAVVDECDDGLFVELIYGENGNPLRRGDKLYTHPAPAVQKVEPTAWYDPDHQDFLTAAGRAATLRMGDGDRLARYTVPLYAAPTAAEELDSVRHWRGKHAEAVRELAAAHQLKRDFDEWVDKSQWIRAGSHHTEWHMHPADVIKKRYDQLQTKLAERDALLLLISEQPALNPIHRARIKTLFRDSAGPGADAGEVQRLRNLHAAMTLQRDHHREKADALRVELVELRKWEALVRENSPLILMKEQAEKERDALRARLDELDTLLREAIPMLLDDAPGNPDIPLEKLRDALSASAERNQCDGCQAGVPLVNGIHRTGKPGGYPDAMICQAGKYASAEPGVRPACFGRPSNLPKRAEPSAPVEIDERAAFEAFALDKGWLPHQLKQRPDGNYEDWGVNPEWQAWKARAALERKP